MEYRQLGKTKDSLSVIGFGGIIVMDETPEDAAWMVGAAIDEGVTYFDVAPSYGNAEERLGPALHPYREKVFLACKTGCRDAKGVRAELDNSLKLLRTDHFDLYQMHAVTTVEDVETICSADGALEAFIRAREQGKVRNLGFSAHSEEAALALLDRFSFDSVLFPLNFCAYLKGNFGPAVVSAAQKKGVALLALKGMASGQWGKDPGSRRERWKKAWYSPLDNMESARRALRFTLSLPVTAAIPPGHYELWKMAIDIAKDLTPLSEDEIARLKADTDMAEPVFSSAG